MKRTMLALAVSALSGCGGGQSTANSTPTAPSQPPAQANRAPTISQLSVTPGFGISQLTSFGMQGAATDLDGDPVTYQWELGDGGTAAGSSVPAKIFTGSGGAITVRLTVSDGKGGSASDTRSIIVGSLTGTWIATIQGFARLQLELQQTGGTVAGRFVQLDAGPQTPAGTSGTTDPAEPGKIDRDGRVEIRLKVGRFLDFYIRGTMDTTGRTVSGGVFGSGFNGNATTMVKQ